MGHFYKVKIENNVLIELALNRNLNFLNLLKVAEHLTVKFLEKPHISSQTSVFSLRLCGFQFFGGAPQECLRSTCAPWSIGWKLLLYGLTLMSKHHTLNNPLPLTVS